MVLIYGDILSDFHPEGQSNIGLETSYSNQFLLCLSKFSYNCFIYLFISHMQQVVFWTIWKILYLGVCVCVCVYCLPVCFFSNQSKLSLNWLGATFLATVWTCFHNKLSGACLLLAQEWETELYFLSWDMLQKPVTVHFHWLQWTYSASLIHWPHIYSLINAFNMLPNQEELAGVLSTSICRLTC